MQAFFAQSRKIGSAGGAIVNKIHPEMKEALHVGVVTYTQGDPFINAMTDNLKENLKSMETEDMKIIVSVKNGKDDQQQRNSSPTARK